MYDNGHTFWESGYNVNRKFNSSEGIEIDGGKLGFEDVGYVKALPTVRWDDIVHPGEERKITTKLSNRLSDTKAIYCTKIMGNLIIGSCPRLPPHITHTLPVHLGASAVLNLQEIEDIWKHAKESINYKVDDNITDHLEEMYNGTKISLVHMPTKDLCAGTKRQMMSHAAYVLNGLLSKGHNVYVHCTCGIGRAVAAVAAYMICVAKWKPIEVMIYIGMRRPVAYFDMKAMNCIGRDYEKKFG